MQDSTKTRTERSMILIGHEGKIYEMSGPEALNMEEIAEQISYASQCDTLASLGKKGSRRY
jgi:uncharacterized protein YbjT (DUF2867 family)